MWCPRVHVVRWVLRIICDLCPVPFGTLLPLQPFSVTLCMFVSCMYYLCMCICMEAQGQHQLPSSVALDLNFLRQGLSLSLKLSASDRLAAPRPLEPACLHPSSSGGTDTCYRVWLFTLFLGTQTSRPRASVAGTLLTELPPQLCHDMIGQPRGKGVDVRWRS